MIRILASVLLLTLIGSINGSLDCQCRRASDEDVPHGANESIEYSERTLKSIHGKVFFSTYAPVKDAVVEIYDYTDADRNLSPYNLVRSKDRRAACLTDKDGNYCFTGLPSGRYVLRAGTRTSEGENEVYARVKLDRSWWKFWRFQKGLNLTLWPGT